MEKPPAFEEQITFLHTNKLTETAHFYEEKLGFERALDQGTCLIFRVCGSAFIGFCTKDKGARPEGIILTLVTEHVEAWYRYLDAQGLSFEKPPSYSATYDITQAFVRDPNGYLIEIQRFEDPRWTP
jgi:catechol 2,3-dioxygenase-like lactoylglutathione lyase family enzyme